MSTRSKQSWETGSIVKVGFLSLKVLKKIATPGNYLPDQYALASLDGSRFYKFIPHNGLERCDSLAQACAW
jgi:hypothetical protein